MNECFCVTICTLLLPLLSIFIGFSNVVFNVIWQDYNRFVVYCNLSTKIAMILKSFYPIAPVLFYVLCIEHFKEFSFLH